MNFVLDAALALSWCFEDEGGDYALDVLEALRSSEAVAASIWPLEVTNGLLTAVRRKRIDSAQAGRFARLVLALPIAIDPVSRSRVFEATERLARKHKLSTYDASYLELAVRHDLPIATMDAALEAAAVAEGIQLFNRPGVPQQ